jgi:large subunit ribosomal protein L4
MSDSPKVSLPVHDLTGQQIGTYEFDLAELAEGVNHQLLHDAVVMYQANQRSGTVKTKNRGEVAGSKKKMYRQKGTGRARMGNKRTGIRRGGGTIHRVLPRDYGYRLPRKALQLATRMALLSKFRDNQVTVVDSLTLPELKTRAMAKALKALGLAESSCLVATDKYDAGVLRCTRNIPAVELAPASELNAYVVLRQRNLLVTRAALDRLRSRSA